MYNYKNMKNKPNDLVYNSFYNEKKNIKNK